MVVDQNKNVLWAATYDEFGKVLTQSGSILMSLRYPGQVDDPEFGYYYNWHRWYDFVRGRYLSTDPMDEMGDYPYAGGNPNKMLDPRGLQTGPVVFENAGGTQNSENSGSCDPISSAADYLRWLLSLFEGDHGGGGGGNDHSGEGYSSPDRDGTKVDSQPFATEEELSSSSNNGDCYHCRSRGCYLACGPEGEVHLGWLDARCGQVCADNYNTVYRPGEGTRTFCSNTGVYLSGESNNPVCECREQYECELANNGRYNSYAQ